MSKSNLAVVMDLYNVAPQALYEAVGADVTLVSRWRTGNRRLVPGRRWIRGISDYFVTLDAAQGEDRLAALLTVFYPTDDLSTPQALRITLEKWLAVRDQCEGDYALRRDRLIEALFGAGESDSPIRQMLETRGPYISRGESETHAAILDMLDKAANLDHPVDIRFVCPEGLALLTQDAAFSAQMMDKLTGLFERGFRLHVVLTVDYKMSEVSAFSGRWLGAHLMGYVRSYYRNDFFQPHEVCMMAVFEDKIAMRVLRDSIGGISGEFYYSIPRVKALAKEIDSYFQGASMRFHYDYFPQPDDYLAKAPDVMGDCYLITRLPHFGVRGGLIPELFNLTEDEAERFRAQFAPLMITPDTAQPGDNFYHILCPEEIERALDKPRHRVLPAGEMFGRRVYMTTQVLVDQLVDIRTRLKTQSNYHVCFLPERHFDTLRMELAVYGRQVAVGWISGQSSTACKDPVHVAILQGFAAVSWNRIPGMAKTRGGAAKRINGWLRRAKNFGYTVTG